MGRRRQSRLDLPPRMHPKGSMYYYVTSTAPRKWIKLDADLTKARLKWAELENSGENIITVGSLIDAWFAAPKDAPLAESTLRCYHSVASQLRAFFGQSPADRIEPHHVAAWLDNHASRSRANLGKALLSNAMDLAVRRGIRRDNPCKHISRLRVAGRTRYITDDEYQDIRSHATPILRAAMDISYVTGARISDVLAIRRQHWTKDGLTIRQIKTGKLQLFKRTAILEQVIDQALSIPREVRGLHLLSTRTGQPYKYSTILSWWNKATAAAGVDDANFHDIRGKAATDAKREGIDYQALLGHTSRAMSDRYIKLEEAQQVDPMKRIL